MTIATSGYPSLSWLRCNHIANIPAKRFNVDINGMVVKLGPTKKLYLCPHCNALASSEVVRQLINSAESNLSRGIAFLASIKKE